VTDLRVGVRVVLRSSYERVFGVKGLASGCCAHRDEHSGCISVGDFLTSLESNISVTISGCV
jgi:hypothetical protein